MDRSQWKSEKAYAFGRILESIIKSNSGKVIAKKEDELTDCDPFYEHIQNKMPYVDYETFEENIRMIFQPHADSTDTIISFYREHLPEFYIKYTQCSTEHKQKELF